jgi:hypothetical protein
MKVQELKEKEKKKQEEARLRLEWEEREKRRRETEIKDIQVTFSLPCYILQHTVQYLAWFLRAQIRAAAGLRFFYRTTQIL